MLSITENRSNCTMPAKVKKFPFKVKGRTPTVLFIDDDANFCRCFRRRFHRSGLRFFDAQTGVEGYRLAVDLLPDVIVTDLAMPFGAGEELLAALQENSATWAIPIVVITGLVDDDRLVQLQRFGITHVLRKPFIFEDLLSAIFDSIAESP
jgi:CheY-like chemotaxis protein